MLDRGHYRREYIFILHHFGDYLYRFADCTWEFNGWVIMGRMKRRASICGSTFCREKFIDWDGRMAIVFFVILRTIIFRQVTDKASYTCPFFIQERHGLKTREEMKQFMVCFLFSGGPDVILSFRTSTFWRAGFTRFLLNSTTTRAVSWIASLRYNNYLFTYIKWRTRFARKKHRMQHTGYKINGTFLDNHETV